MLGLAGGALVSLAGYAAELASLDRIATRYHFQVTTPQPFVEFGGEEPSNPERWGYRLERDSFFWEPGSEPPFLHERFSFLRQRPVGEGRPRLVILGGSVAWGFGASRLEARWWHLLQGEVPEFEILPLAGLAYNSAQERIVLELAALPLRPAAVLVLDGYNDLMGCSATIGSRPGDPLNWGLKLTREAIGEPNQAEFAAALRERLERFARAPASYAEPVAACYLDSTRRLVARCEEAHVPVLVVLQPCRALTSSRAASGDAHDVLARATYATARRGLPAGVVDLSEKITWGRGEVYTDECHVNDEGQKVLAEALLPHARRLLPPR